MQGLYDQGSSQLMLYYYKSLLLLGREYDILIENEQIL